MKNNPICLQTIKALTNGCSFFSETDQSLSVICLSHIPMTTDQVLLRICLQDVIIKTG